MVKTPSSKSHQERDSERTREQLIAAAKKLFAKKGFSGTSVKELVDEAGVNISLVSYYFDGKEGLYRACLEEFTVSKLQAVERILKAPHTVEELRVRLGMFMEEMISSALQEPELTTIIQRDVEMENPVTEQIFRERFHPLFQVLVEFIKAGQRNGLIRRDVVALNISSFIMGVLMHHVRSDHLAQKFHGVTIKDEKHREGVIRDALRVFIEGLLAAETAHEKKEL